MNKATICELIQVAYCSLCQSRCKKSGGYCKRSPKKNGSKRNRWFFVFLKSFKIIVIYSQSLVYSIFLVDVSSEHGQ